ncbi:MAG: MoaD/ThiS family protein [Isosphaeraceae bacterium]
MRVAVRLFAIARQKFGRPVAEVELDEGATVADLRSALAGLSPELAPLMPRVMIALGTDYATDDQRVTEGAEVAVIPPVSGGSTEFESGRTESSR